MQEQALPREAGTHQAAPWPEAHHTHHPNRKSWILEVNFNSAIFMQRPHSFPMKPRHTATFTRGTCVPQCAADPGQHLGCPGHPLPAAPGANRTGVQAENAVPTGRAVSESPLLPSWVRTIPVHHKGRGQSWWRSARQIQGNTESWAQTLRARKSPCRKHADSPYRS